MIPISLSGFHPAFEGVTDHAVLCYTTLKLKHRQRYRGAEGATLPQNKIRGALPPSKKINDPSLVAITTIKPQ